MYEFIYVAARCLGGGRHSRRAADASFLVRRQWRRLPSHLLPSIPGCRRSIPGDGVGVACSDGGVSGGREPEEEGRGAFERCVDCERDGEGDHKSCWGEHLFSCVEAESSQFKNNYREFSI